MQKVLYPSYFPSIDSERYGAVPDAVAPTGQPAQPKQEERELTEEEVEAGLPKPVGYKLLLALPDIEDKYEGTSILKVKSTVEAEQITSVVALVLDMGDMAYQDEKRFPTGPWCKVGDYVLIRPYQGTRFVFGNREYRMVSDDGIEGIVRDPRNYRRV